MCITVGAASSRDCSISNSELSRLEAAPTIAICIYDNPRSVNNSEFPLHAEFEIEC